MKKTLFVLFLVILTVLVGFSCAKKDASKSFQNIVFYANITAIEPILEEFEQKTGIPVEYHRISATDFYATVMNEYEAGLHLADVIQAPIAVLELLTNEGILLPYVSAAAIDFPDWAKREKEGIYKFAIEYVSVIFNKDFIDFEDIPKEYQDLADPKWKNKIVMPNPTIHPTTISWLVALKEHVFENDESQWEKFIRGLAANNPLFVDSFTPTSAVIISGEKPIGISMPKYIITNAPNSLDWANIEPILGSLRGIGISANAPNPDGARQFIDFWLSDDVGRFLANEVGEYVLVPDVFPPLEGMDTANIIPIVELSDEEINRWGSFFKDVFGV